MNTVVIEHVEIAKLPLAWRKKLATASAKSKTVTVRIEPEQVPPDTAVGMWKDREDMADPVAWVRAIRAGRFEQP